MALNSTVLGDLIASKMESSSTPYRDYPNEIKQELRNTLIKSIAEAVVEHVKASGVVTVTLSSGITASACAAGGAAGTIVSGAGTGTIS